MMRKYGELLSDVAVRLRTASTTEQLQKILMEVAAALRFKYIWCGAHQGAGRTVCDCDAMHNFPASWIARRSRVGEAGLGPMQAYAELGPGGFAWDDERFLRWLSTRQKAFLHDARTHGLSNGYTFPLSHEVGAAASCSIVPLDDAIDLRALDLAHMLIPTMYARFVLLRRDRRQGKAKLSPRQRECLSLKARGETDGEIASELGIHIGTVARHLDLAKQSLSARSREHAVAIGLKSGQIT